MDTLDGKKKPVIPDWISKSGWLNADNEPEFSAPEEKEPDQKSEIPENPLQLSENELSETGLSSDSASLQENQIQDEAPFEGSSIEPVEENPYPVDIPTTNDLSSDIPEPPKFDLNDEEVPDLPDWLKNYEPGQSNREVLHEEFLPVPPLPEEINGIPEPPPLRITEELPDQVGSNTFSEVIENEKDQTVSIEEVEGFEEKIEPTDIEVVLPPLPVEEGIPSVDDTSDKTGSDLQVEELIAPVDESSPGVTGLVSELLPEQVPSPDTLPESESTDESTVLEGEAGLVSSKGVQEIVSDEIMELPPETPSVTLEAIIDHLQQGNYPELSLLAREYELSDQPIEDLITKVQDLSAEKGASSQYWLFLGDLLDHNGQFDKAIEAYRIAENILIN